MENKRWYDVMLMDEPLTPEEMAEGWHFCMDWDGLLVGPDMKEEYDVCTCVPKEGSE